MSEKEDEPKVEDESEKSSTYRKNSWMLRSYDMYREEYSDCISLKARFHQYFVYGKMIDCSQWKTDSENAYLWERYKSEAAYNALVESEKKHRLERLKGHYLNDVWERRTEPPKEWTDPLPEELEKALQYTYLSLQKERLKSGEIEPLRKHCTIL